MGRYRVVTYGFNSLVPFSDPDPYEKTNTDSYDEATTSYEVAYQAGFTVLIWDTKEGRCDKYPLKNSPALTKALNWAQKKYTK
jgi:hypothetical protein